VSLTNVRWFLNSTSTFWLTNIFILVYSTDLETNSSEPLRKRKKHSSKNGLSDVVNCDKKLPVVSESKPILLLDGHPRTDKEQLILLGDASPTARTIPCSRCSFKEIVEWDQPVKKRTNDMKNANRSLTRHFLSAHLSIEPNDYIPHKSDPNLLHCYSCPACDFQTLPMTTKECIPKRRERMLALYKHYIEYHDGQQATVKDPKPNDLILTQDQQLLEGTEFFKCPQPGCNFFSHVLKEGEAVEMYRETISRKFKNMRSTRALSKLGRHFMKMHDFPQAASFSQRGHAETSHPCKIVSSDGKRIGYKCPRCEYTVHWEEGTNAAYIAFSWHYGLHLYGPGGDPLKPEPLLSF
jgi:hypothetical protein